MDDYTNKYLDMLGSLSIPYYLKSSLEEKYHSQVKRIQQNIEDRIVEYKKRITYIANLLKSRGHIGKDLPPEELAAPLTPNSDLSYVAEEAAIYFQQGLEMLQTSQNMHENTSPLVEYYGFLQCVKGSIILELEVKDERFFSKHGLTLAKQKPNSRYISAEIKAFGVFQALVLCRKPSGMTPEETMDTFFSGSYCPSLEEIVTGRHAYGDPIFAFIGSWMLSTLVRYRPRMWQEIQLGLKDDIIRLIRNYRIYEISFSIRNLLTEYAPHRSGW